MLKRFIENIELWLSGAGILVFLGLPWLLTPQGMDRWKVAALSAIAVGTIHGFIFWTIRRRQRRIRREAIAEIRGMLADQVNNQLSVLLLNTSGLPSEESLNQVQAAVESISSQVQRLSEDSLIAWKQHYSSSLEQLAAK